MNYHFDTIFFPAIQWIGIGLMLLALVVVIIICFRSLKDKYRKDIFLWVLCLVLFVMGIIVNSRTRYVVKDYIENKGYTLVVADMGLFESTYRQVDYENYWKDMNWKTYQVDSNQKVIYMRRNKWY